MIWQDVFYNNIPTYISLISEELANEFPPEPLSNHIKIQGGYSFKANEYKSQGVPVIRISDFQDEKIDLSSVKYYKENAFFDRFQLVAGDIIIAMTGGTIGKLAIVQEGLGKLYLNQRVGKFTILQRKEFEQEYIYWLARGIQDKVKNLAYGGAQPNVSNSQIEALQFSFPSKKVQLKIIQFLNDLRLNQVQKKIYFNLNVENRIKEFQIAGVAIFTVLDECKLQESHLQQLRQAILQEAVQGKLSNKEYDGANEFAEQKKKYGKLWNAPASELLKHIKPEKEKSGESSKKISLVKPIANEEVPFDLPDGWAWCRLGGIVDVVSGVTLGKAYNKALILVPYLRVANVQRGYVNLAQVKELAVPESEIEKYALHNGDIVMIEGGDWDKVGRCAIWKGEIKPCIHQNHIFRLRFGSYTLNQWSELFLNSPVARSYFESCSKQTTNLASINKTQLANALFPLPPLSEQYRIVSKVQHLLQMADQLEQQVATSQAKAQQLLQAVLKEGFGGSEKKYDVDELVTLAAER